MTFDDGEWICTSLDHHRAIRVDRADPRLLISGELVREGLRGELHPDVDLDGDRLVINGVNRRVVYRLGAYRPDQDVYEAEWPD